MKALDFIIKVLNSDVLKYAAIVFILLVVFVIVAIAIKEMREDFNDEN
jgi:hypothetical protein